MWNLKKMIQMNLFAEQEQIHRLWKACGYQRGQFGGMDRWSRIGICTLRYMEWLANGDLLYSTGNSAQCSGIIYVGKESEREWIVYIYNWITLLYNINYHNSVNQLYFNKTLKYKKRMCCIYICLCVYIYTYIFIYIYNWVTAV